MEDKILREIGFSEREVKVYLALLKLGETTVGPLAARARMQHSKVYQTLEKLIDKGLVNFIVKSKSKHYSAQDPRQIMNFLKEQERRFNDILPDLDKMKDFSKEKQVAIVYEGQKAIASMFNNILDELQKDSNYYVFGLKEDYYLEDFRRFIRKLHMKLSEKESDNRILLHNSVKQIVLNNSGDIKNIKLKFTDNSFPTGLMIIDNKVINWYWGERPTAVEIKSSLIASQYKKFFIDSWKIAKR